MACSTSTTIAATTSSAAPAAPVRRSWAQIVKKAEPEAPAADVAAPEPAVATAPKPAVAAAPKPVAVAVQKAAGKEVAEAKASSRVEGGSKEKKAQESKPLVPAIKGTMLCKCTGQVLAMMGHYGWILPLEPIDHPMGLSKNEGHVYVSTKDVEGGVSLGVGDFVSFYLYVDVQGLGAEACCLMSRAPASTNTSAHKPAWSSFAFSAAAAEFVPTAAFGTQGMSADAPEFVPAGGPRGMSADALEFVPAAAVEVAFPVPLPEPQPLAAVRNDVNPPPGFSRISVSEINAAYFSDSESSEDEGVEAGDEACSSCGEFEESGSDGEEEKEGGGQEAEIEESLPAPKEDLEEVEVDDELDVVVMCVPLKARRQRAASPDGSTSAGDQSDSEDEFTDVFAPLCPVRVPPGLSVLAG